ncbi:alpha/beta hydrolase-fold protein [Pontiellaceae bacterium B12227]|nr:alpha/beta hydrolase-fold protein [Pontiellaceae bacterium B12227]
MSRFRTTELSDPAFEPDHLRFITVKSPALNGRGDIALFLPDGWESMEELPLLTLLHGVYGSHWVWPFKGGAHVTAHEMIQSGEIRPIAIAMPSDGLWREGSGYLPHKMADYESWIVDDVPAAVMEDCPAVSGNSKHFIAGLSMGGYGALRLGAKYAEQYSAISAHSSITDFQQLEKFVEEPLTDYKLAGDRGLSAIHWMQTNRDQLPPLRFDCGVDDILIEENRELHQQLEAAGIEHSYQEFPGEHAWEYWIEHLRDTLRFIGRHI